MIFIISRLIEFIFICILALGLSKCWRSNVFSLGIQGYYLISSYTTLFLSLLAYKSNVTSTGNVGIFLFVIVAIFLSGLLSYLVSKLFFIVFKKLKDDYFAIASLAFAEALLILISNAEFLGGAKGMSVPVNIDFSSNIGNKMFFLSLLSLIFFLQLYISLKQNKSTQMLVIESLAENELGVKHLGINTEKVRENVFSQSGFWVGISGSIMTFYYISVNPVNYGFLSSIPVLLFVVIGNYSIFKTVLYSFILYFFYELFKINFLGIIPVSIGNTFSGLQGITYGLLLIIAVKYIHSRKTKRGSLWL
jgi:branched-chain amino acid transport system permease protein